MKDYITLIRPKHWIKNIFLFLPLIFGEKLKGDFNDVMLAIGSAFGGFVCFCIAASAIYIFNDIIDRNTDKLHPEKLNRPIAAGRLSTSSAFIYFFVFSVISLICGYILVPALTTVIGIYIVIMILYSLGLKQMIIIDCIIISIGFCLRAIAGAVVVRVPISPWLIICTFALCLFLAFGKRRGEIAQLGENSDMFRKTLGDYTPELLSHMLDVTSVLAIVCFLMYATDARTQEIFGTRNLVYTTPLVLYCIFRFSALTQRGIYSDPVQLIIKDRPFQIGLAIWGILVLWIIYAGDTGISPYLE